MGGEVSTACLGSDFSGRVEENLYSTAAPFLSHSPYQPPVSPVSRAGLYTACFGGAASMPTGKVWGSRGRGNAARSHLSWDRDRKEATSVTSPNHPSPAPDGGPRGPVRPHAATDPALVPEAPEPGPALPEQEVLRGQVSPGLGGSGGRWGYRGKRAPPVAASRAPSPPAAGGSASTSAPSSEACRSSTT